MGDLSNNEENFKWLLGYFGSEYLEHILKGHLAELQATYDKWNGEAAEKDLSPEERIELEKLNERIRQHRQDYEYSLKMIEKMKKDNDTPIQ